MTDKVILALSDSLTGFISFMPSLFGALAVFVAGYLVASLARRLTLEILKVFQLEPFAEKVGLSESLRKLGSEVTPTGLIGDLIKWSVVIMFLSPAAEVLGLQQISVLVHSIIGYIPNVIVAVIIIMFGVIIAEISADFVRGAAVALKSSTANFLAVSAEYVIIVFSVLAALSQMKIAENLVNTLFTGLVAMLALAGGLAFGLGGREFAADILSNIKRALSEKGE